MKGRIPDIGLKTTRKIRQVRVRGQRCIGRIRIASVNNTVQFFENYFGVSAHTTHLKNR